MELTDNIIMDLTFLAEKTETPLVKAAFALAIIVVQDNLKTYLNENQL